MSDIKYNGATPTKILRNGVEINKIMRNGVEYSVARQVNYNWYYNDAKTLVVREKVSDGTFRWYIQNYEINGFMTMPNNLAPFILNSVGANGFMEGYTANPNATIGFYGNTMRAWSIGLATNVYGTVDSCIIESNDPNLDGNEPYHEWEEPTFDPING